MHIQPKVKRYFPISSANILSIICRTRFNNGAIDSFAIRPSDRSFAYVPLLFYLHVARVQVDDPHAKRKFSHASPYTALLSIAFASMNEIKSLFKGLARGSAARRFHYNRGTRPSGISSFCLLQTKKKKKDQAVFFILTGSRNALQYLIP